MAKGGDPDRLRLYPSRTCYRRRLSDLQRARVELGDVDALVGVRRRRLQC